ncbi:MAG: hypothetical protein KDK12_01395 [Rhodobacteraceae bacterium]|nr:hypothetical protein [Paracoccaceae bacterium]
MPESPAAKALLDTFGHLVILNLPERTDRRRGIEAELSKAGLSLDHPAVTLFPALRPAEAAGFPSIGARGAFQSHLAVMEMMLREGWQRLLVLEDDMAFAPGALPRLPALAAALAGRDWSLFYGHPGDLPDRTPAPDAQGLIALPPDLGLIQLHFLGLTREAVSVLLPELRAMPDRPEGSPDGGPMHVDGALNFLRARHPDLPALAVAPAIAVQRASRSDIAAARWFDRLPGLRALSAALRRLR